MGLLDGLKTGQWTGDPDKDQAINRGLLHFGLQLMQTRGKFGPGFGQAGMAGLGGYEHEVNRQLAAKRIGLQDQYLSNQIDQQKREAALANLPGQFIKPEMRGVDATGGMETAVENNTVPASMDLQGLVRAYMAAPGGIEKGFALQQALAPKKPEYKTVGKSLVRIGNDDRVDPVFTDPEEAKKDEQIERLKLIYGDGTPALKAAMQRLGLKMTSHPDPIQVSYGAPMAALNPATGKIELVRPDNKGGMNFTGIEPPPKDPREKDPTEFQSKAGLYFKSMTKATETLDEIERTNGWRPSLAETGAAAKNWETAQTLVQGTSRQKYTQAQKQWIDSINRVRSGANLPELEYHRAVRTFFPTYGEGEELRKQKANARRQEEEAMREAAGRALPQQPQQQAAPSGLPSMADIEAEIARRRARGQ
jgi:hypothetical protein